ncbi:MAG: hypothetical protein QXK57_06905 [Conexivisphaerales archaeon]
MLSDMLAMLHAKFPARQLICSDVMIAIHNLHILLLSKRGITTSHDGTGYLTINYAKKDMAKVNKKRQLFAYMFAIIDLKDVYLIRKSERNAFGRAMAISHGC